MLVLGIDPGTRYLGWGVVLGEANRLKYKASGVLRLPEKEALSERLVQIERGLDALIARFSPEVASVESLFFHKDAQAAAKLGHARGVVLLSVARAKVKLAEYPPARVKSTVVGNGQASKGQVAHMIKALLNLDEPPPSDAADALALAVTHLRRAPHRVDRPDAPIANLQLAELLKQKARSRKRRGPSSTHPAASAKNRPTSAA